MPAFKKKRAAVPTAEPTGRDLPRRPAPYLQVFPAAIFPPARMRELTYLGNLCYHISNIKHGSR